MFDKVLVIDGEHKGKIGTVTGMFWMAGMCTVKFDDGTEHSVGITDVKKINN